MKTLLRAAAALLAVSFVSGFSGCASTSGEKCCTDAKCCVDGKCTLANTKCPVSDDGVSCDNPAVDYQGKRIAFCCDKCVTKWNGMDDGAKAKALEGKLK
ncbi:MAG: hypothetical protein JNK49_18600 [Planctomycetes bacterium]|nr:hypothetical protein [Planctomycetota bacterium]